jgi:TonB family protein
MQYMQRVILLALAAVLILRADSPGITVEPGGPLLHRSDIEYPRGITGAHGTVVVGLSLDQNGEVNGAEVLSGPPELRRAVLRSVADWHYSPEMTLPAKVQASITFSLSEAAERPEPFSVPVAPLGKLMELKISGLTQPAHDALLQRLPVHEGDVLTPDSVVKARETALAFDSHLSFAITATAVGSFIRITAPGQRPSYAASDENPGAPQRIRVGGNVQAAKLISSTPPVMPPLAQQARISGVVRLNVIIGKDGHVENITVRSGHPLLVPSALESVKTYVYQPTLLNGAPVEVVTQVDVNFSAEASGPTP